MIFATNKSAMNKSAMTRALCIGVLAIASCVASAQSASPVYPDRPIRLVSPFPAGGGTDYVARLLATRLAAQGWTVTVDNRAGANGTIGVAEIARARPEGYELAIGQRDNLVFAPHFQKVPYDTARDFQPVAYIARTPIILVAATDGKYQTFAEVVAAARAQPGSVSIGSSGHGSASHIASELLRTRGGVQLQHVPYRGSAPALADLVGGQIDLAGSSIASTAGLRQAGKLRALAVVSNTRSPLLPDVPALAELGLAEIEVQSWYGLFAPAGLPAEITRLLHATVSRVVQAPEVIAALNKQGLEPQQMSVDEFTRFVSSDYQDIEAVLVETGIGQQ